MYIIDKFDRIRLLRTIRLVRLVNNILYHKTDNR